jgi:hypothetical protein
MSNATKVTKLQAAHMQLNAAIRLHLSDFDALAVHTLAGAASTLFSDLIAQHDLAKSMDQWAQEANAIDAKTYFRIMRKAQNFLKHAGKDPEEALEFDPIETEHLMFFATINAGSLSGISTYQQVYQLWYIAKHASMFNPAFAPLPVAKEMFPGVAELGPEQQKQAGLQRLEEELQS